MFDQAGVALEWVYEWAINYGYLSLAVLTFVNGTGLPVPAELSILALVTLVRNQAVSLWPAIFLASGANVMGSLIPFTCAQAGLNHLTQRLLPHDGPARQRVERWVTGSGAIALAVTRVIGFMRMAVIVTAGMLRMRYGVFILALYTGAVCWLFIGYRIVITATEKTRFMGAEHNGYTTSVWIVAAIAVVFIMLTVSWRRYKRVTSKP